MMMTLNKDKLNGWSLDESSKGIAQSYGFDNIIKHSRVLKWNLAMALHFYMQPKFIMINDHI